MHARLAPCFIAISLFIAVVPAALAQEDVCPPEPVLAPETELSAAIDTVVDAAVADGFDGQVAIWRDDLWLYQRAAGYANRRNTIAVTAETRFHLASITKYLTAALVLEAISSGRLDPGSPVDPYLPATRIAARGTTIAELLSHTSGLASSYAAESEDTWSGAVNAIDAVDFDPERRGTFGYSNDGYDLLAVVLERLYDASYESIARAGILDAACLTNTGFWGDADLTNPARTAQPGGRFPSRLVGRNYGTLGSSGFLASASDLVRLQAAVLEGDLLTGSARDELFAPRGEMSLGSASYGAFLIDHPRLGRVHSARGSEDWGDNAYLNTYFDCGIILAVTTTSGQTGRDNILFRDRITTAVEQLLEPYCPIHPAMPEE